MANWLVILNGYPQSGKDTFANLCDDITMDHDDFVEEEINVYHKSTVDNVKKALKTLGWDGVEKTPEMRNAMSDLKDLSTKLFDGPFKYVQRQFHSIKGYNENSILFVDCREPKEIERFVKEIPGTKTLLIDVDRPDNLPGNHADDNVTNYQYEFVISNRGTIEDLREKAIEFLRQLGFGKRVG